MNVASRSRMSFRFNKFKKPSNGGFFFGKTITKKRMSLVAAAAPLFIETKSDCPFATIQNNIEKLQSKFHEYMESQANKSDAIIEEVVEAETQVKEYTEIPQPRSLPLIGSVLDYTAVGEFTPMEFDKALVSRHKK